MKEILSYWDISLGLIAIGFGSYRFIKYEKYKKKRDNDMLKKQMEYGNYRIKGIWMIATHFFVFIPYICWCSIYLQQVKW